MYLCHCFSEEEWGGHSENSKKGSCPSAHVMDFKVHEASHLQAALQPSSPIYAIADLFLLLLLLILFLHIKSREIQLLHYRRRQNNPI